MTDSLNNLDIETAGMDEEAAEHIEVALGMEVEADDGREGKEGGDRNQRALGALEFITKDADPSRTTLVGAHNGFNEL